MTTHMQELKEKKIWVLCRIEIRKGKKAKVPISIRDGPTGTDEKWRDTWATYDEAAEALKTVPGAVGLGFVIPEGFFFIDIDGKPPGDPFVQKIIKRHESYTEYSFSGNGIHIYGKNDLSRIPTCNDKSGRLILDRQFYTKNPNNGMEVYIGGLTNRFALFTEKEIESFKLKDCTDALLITLDKDMRRKQKVKFSPKRDDDKEIFDIVCALRKQKNGAKFIKLYDEGDWSDYKSQSEGDMAMFIMIAFRAGPDVALIIRVALGSAMYRDKWKREDYLIRTAEAAIEACNGNFHKSKMDHPYFVKFNEQTFQPYVSVPLLAKYVREHLKYILVRDNGKQGILKYIYENGCYRLYSNDMFMGRIKQYIAEYDEELVKMGQVAEALNHITTDLNYVSQDDLNADEDLINMPNGLLRVTADDIQLFPHSPDVLSTIQIPCEWKGVPSPTPVFDSYLNTLTNGDKATEQLLLEFIGVCISNVKGSRMKKALFLVGNGDTGKSQLKSLVERLLGRGNFIGIDLKEIEARFGTGAIYGTRLAGSSDMSFLSVNELKAFKMITGGDAIFAEFKGLQGFQYTYNGLLWFCMNRLPKFGGDDGQWVYDRIMVVNCPNVIPKDKQDKKLLDKMYAERDGIVYKAVKALQTVIANGYRFSEPQKVIEARQEYKSTNSTVISFFNECMCPWPGGRINHYCTTGRIYRVYQAWCRENNNGYAKTAKEFREELAEYLGATFAEISTRQKGNTYYKNYSLTQEAKELFVKEYGYDSTTDFL